MAVCALLLLLGHHPALAIPAGEEDTWDSDNTAKVVIKVPEGARVFVGGDKNQSEAPVKKTECRFSSAIQLNPGEPDYYCTVRVKYTAGEKEYSETRKVRMFAGKTTELDLSDLASPSKKLRTYNYWCEVNVIANEWLPKSKDAKAIEFARAIKRIAIEIDDLPVRYVDEEAVRVIQDMAEHLGKMVQFFEENDGAGRVGEAVLRGFFGDPFGVAREVTAEQKSLSKDGERVRARLKKMRAILTARYNIEFPKLH
jgi:hypothetical protein